MARIPASGGSVALPEIPYIESLSLAAPKTALVVVDMQNDFVKSGGSLFVPDAAGTVPGIQRLLTEARRQGVHIAFTQDTHFEGDPEAGIWPAHCLENSPGWEIIGELKPQPGELICRKNRYDGFYGTWLDHFLSHIWRVQHLVIVGTVANICVLHTAASAGLRWFQVVVPADGVSALTEFDLAATFRQVAYLYGGKVLRKLTGLRFTS
jgi:nicotinamidase-related amidase